MSAPAFGAEVLFSATVERLTARIALADVLKPMHGVVSETWVPLESEGMQLQIVDVWAQGGGMWPNEDPFRWPGEDVSGGKVPWAAGVFSLVRRFPCEDFITRERLVRRGLWLSSSWRTEGQRYKGGSFGYLGSEDWEPASFEQWRRVPVHWVALDPRGFPGRPRIVSVLPDDLRVADS